MYARASYDIALLFKIVVTTDSTVAVVHLVFCNLVEKDIAEQKFNCGQFIQGLPLLYYKDTENR